MPVIVISENERFPGDNETNNPIIPDNPTNLTGITTESGIRLTWQMPATSGRHNTIGYYIYRKGANDPSFIVINTVIGAFNRVYDDNNVIPNSSYAYFVTAFYLGEISQPSNIINITAPNFPKPVISFEAIQNSKNEIELRWQNDHSQFIQETKLYRHIHEVTPDYLLIGSFTPSQHHYFDRNVSPGKKVNYKINHVTSLGESNPKFDFVHVPYRDISQGSPVYIKRIKFSDWKIERWPAGKPEFYVTVTNVDPVSKTPYTVQDQIVFHFNSKSNISQVFTGRKVIDWRPGFWYDMLTFTAVEFDRSWGKLDFYISVGFNLKDTLMQGLRLSGSVNYELTFNDTGEECGNSSLNFYDNPEQWLEFPNYGVQILVSESDN